MSLLGFELRRAAYATVGWFGLFGTLASAGVFWALLAGGSRFAGGVAPNLAIGVLGFFTAAASALTTAERNRGTVVEDIWWALEPRAMVQTLQVFLAWAIVGAVQGSAIALIVGISIGATNATAFVLGYVAGLPLGFAQTSLARRIPGTTMLAGLSMFATLFLAGPIARQLTGTRSEEAGLAVVYVAICIGFAWILSRGMYMRMTR